MDRRTFLSLSAASLAGWGLSGILPLQAMGRGSRKEAYNIIILGDTHYDTEPAEVYHSHYDEPTEWLNRVQRAEFARNGEMWRERCPRLIKRAACLMDGDTLQVLQMGDLIQGDCGSGEVHRKMLDDVMDSFKASFGGSLPLVTVVGNHDIWKEWTVNTYREAKQFTRRLGPDYYRTDVGDPQMRDSLECRHCVIGDVHILCITPDGRDPVVYPEKSIRWLDETLAQITAEHPGADRGAEKIPAGCRLRRAPALPPQRPAQHLARRFHRDGHRLGALHGHRQRRL